MKTGTHLGREDEARERGTVDPGELVQDGHGGEDPVAIADLLFFGLKGRSERAEGGRRNGNKRICTSSSFSGRPFMPPLGSCLSASHHPSVGTSTTSNRSRIASAAVHTHTAKIK